MGYVLWIAAFNTALGFALAVYLRARWQMLVALRELPMEPATPSPAAAAETTVIPPASPDAGDAPPEAASEIPAPEVGLADLVAAIPSSSPSPAAVPEADLAEQSAVLDAWCGESAQQVNRCLAIVALDDLASLRETRGPAVVATLLAAVGRWLESEVGTDRLKRLGGERFALRYDGEPATAVADNIERLRQLCQRISFTHPSGPLAVRLSCAVVQGRDGDTGQEILSRAQQTLHEALRYGGNRTFLHEGHYPTPVIPPQFTVESKTIAL